MKWTNSEVPCKEFERYILPISVAGDCSIMSGPSIGFYSYLLNVHLTFLLVQLNLMEDSWGSWVAD